MTPLAVPTAPLETQMTTTLISPPAPPALEHNPLRIDAVQLLHDRPLMEAINTTSPVTETRDLELTLHWMELMAGVPVSTALVPNLGRPLMVIARGIDHQGRERVMIVPELHARLITGLDTPVRARRSQP